MFAAIQTAPLPEDALLARYARIAGGFTDCYVTDLSGSISLADYVTAFYTTPLFRKERWVLALLARSPSTDAEAADLGQGVREGFSLWQVEARRDTELLMCPRGGRTRSWFRVEAGDETTRLHFGSAVVPRDGQRGLGPVFTALLGAHGVYSRALLNATRARLLA